MSMLEPTRSFLRLFLPANPFWSIPSFIQFWKSYFAYAKLSGRRPEYRRLFPCFRDRVPITPVGYYFYQDCWAFRKVVSNKPSLHVDIGSTALLVGCFAASVATLSIDFRPLAAESLGLRSMRGSILQLPFKDDSLESISSLCVIEHIGLGRYGDPLDPDGTAKAAQELQRVLKHGGHLYVSVPCGESYVAFNAHRSFTREEVLTLFDGLRLMEFVLVGNRGVLRQPEKIEKSDFPVGLFYFTKQGAAPDCSAE